MTRGEFKEIEAKFNEEEKRWSGIKKGDIIYDEQIRWIDVDYHKMIIKEVNYDERYVIAYDVANPDYSAKLTYFLTEEEFKNK
ncbi:MAG: hypothetical protein ACOC2W_02615 [bacterium]